MTLLSGAVLASLLSLAANGPSTHSASARLVGRVTAGTGQPVPLARVAVIGTDREAVTDSVGGFALDGVPAGTPVVTVRAIGYAPQDTIINVVDGGTTTLDFVIERMVTLPGLTTRAMVESERLADFLHTQKASANDAYFVQPTRIEGQPSTQTICQLISSLPRIGRCRAIVSRGMPKTTIPICDRRDGFILNGKAVRFDFDDIRPEDIIGIEVARTEDRLGGHYAGIVRALQLCPVVVWTR